MDPDRAARPRPLGPGAAARVVNVVLGAWLFASAFLWPHLGSDGFNTWVTALAVLTCAVMAFWAPAFRWGSAFAAVWLAVMAVTLGHATAFTLWHNLAVALAVLAASLVPSRPRLYDRERAPA